MPRYLVAIVLRCYCYYGLLTTAILLVKYLPAELVEVFPPYKPSAKHPVPIPVPIVEQDKYTYFQKRR